MLQVYNRTRSLTPTSFTMKPRFWALELLMSDFITTELYFLNCTLDSALGSRNLSVLKCGNAPIVKTAAHSNCLVYSRWFLDSWWISIGLLMEWW